MSVNFANVNEIRMRWEEHGEGPAVIFIHGIPTSPLLWRYVLPELRKFRCLAWEMVGYGDSLPQGENRVLSVARQADYLIEWMDAVDIGEAILVGHDLGGGVAQIASVRHRERVKGLVLVNSICYDSWPIPSVKALQTLAPLVKGLPDVMIAAIFAVLFVRGHEHLDQAREALRVHFQYYRQHGAARGLVRQVSSLDVNDTVAISQQLPSLDLPARLVWGAADRFQKVAYGERLAADLGAPLARIETGKHFVPEDHPQRVVEAVRQVAAAV
ncbi:MAG: alpha/beta fold hydrolase [Bacteroidota bacterium]